MQIVHSSVIRLQQVSTLISWCWCTPCSCVRLSRNKLIFPRSLFVADTTSEDLKSQQLPQESHTARSSQSHFQLHRGKIHLSFTWQVLHTPRMPILKAKDCSYSKCQIQFRCSRRVRVQQLRRGSQSLWQLLPMLMSLLLNTTCSSPCKLAFLAMPCGSKWYTSTSEKLI
jgi:hypothetical protein